jgi:hypothetical protein
VVGEGEARARDFGPVAVLPRQPHGHVTTRSKPFFIPHASRIHPKNSLFEWFAVSRSAEGFQGVQKPSGSIRRFLTQAEWCSHQQIEARSSAQSGLKRLCPKPARVRR